MISSWWVRINAGLHTCDGTGISQQQH